MVARIALKVLAIPKVKEFDVVRGDYHLTLEMNGLNFHSPHMCSVIAIQILDAFLFSSGNQNLPQSDQALRLSSCTVRSSKEAEAVHGSRHAEHPETKMLYCTLYCTVLHCTVLHCTALHCTVLHCSLHCTALHCTALHCTVVCTALHCTALHCTALHCTALHCTALHCTALHCTVLYCTVLHCTVLHCTVLHCTYLILTEYEVNIGNKSRVKDRGEAEVFYEVFISYTDQVRSQY